MPINAAGSVSTPSPKASMPNRSARRAVAPKAPSRGGFAAPGPVDMRMGSTRRPGTLGGVPGHKTASPTQTLASTIRARKAYIGRTAGAGTISNRIESRLAAKTRMLTPSDYEQNIRQPAGPSDSLVGQITRLVENADVVNGFDHTLGKRLFIDNKRGTGRFENEPDLDFRASNLGEHAGPLRA